MIDATLLHKGLTVYFIIGVPLVGAGVTCNVENVIQFLSNPNLLPFELYNEENVQPPPDSL